MITYSDYDSETAREVVMEWFEKNGYKDFTSDDVADVLDEFEDTIDSILFEDGIVELDRFLDNKIKG